MDTAPKTLNLDDYLMRAVGGTGITFHDFVGQRGGETVSLDHLSHNVAMLNRAGDNVRWIMAHDNGAVPYDYLWTAMLSLGECRSIAEGRALSDHALLARPVQGRVDFAIIHHCGENRRMEVLAMFELAEDAVYQQLAA